LLALISPAASAEIAIPAAINAKATSHSPLVARFHSSSADMSFTANSFREVNGRAETWFPRRTALR
jgi:hypothetical protein